MKIKLIMAIVFCLALGFGVYAFSSKSTSELDRELANYNAWKTIHVTSTVNGLATNYRSDGEYQKLLQAFRTAGRVNYHETKKWLEKNEAIVPSPIFWSMAFLSLNNNESIEYAAKWLVLGSITGRFDASKCADQKASDIFYMNTLYENDEILSLMREHPVEYQKGRQAGFDKAKAMDYHPSPMWICSLGSSSFGTIASNPNKYGNRVAAIEKQPYVWSAYLANIESTIRKKKVSH